MYSIAFHLPLLIQIAIPRIRDTRILCSAPPPPCPPPPPSLLLQFRRLSSQDIRTNVILLLILTTLSGNYIELLPDLNQIQHVICACFYHRLFSTIPRTIGLCHPVFIQGGTVAVINQRWLSFKFHKPDLRPKR